MSTFTQIPYHVVFATKDRLPALSDARRNDLFMYMSGVIKHSGCRTVWIGGVKDHIHILSSLHATIAISEFVKSIKVATSIWIKENSIFRNFTGWQEGYGAFTHSLRDEPDLIA